MQHDSARATKRESFAPVLLLALEGCLQLRPAHVVTDRHRIDVHTHVQ